MNDYSKITALYSRLSVADEDRDAAKATAYRTKRTFVKGDFTKEMKFPKFGNQCAFL